MSALLVVQYGDIGRVAREWDEHHHYLAAAAEQVAEAPVAGLSPPVVGAAMMFRYSWAEHVHELGEQAEHHADGLRDTLRDLVSADESSAAGFLPLDVLLAERR